MQNSESVKRFYLVDILRGVAALSVLVWHYSHFQSPSGRADQPFYEVFRLLYDRGHWAVQLFWAISGFVFFAVYRAENLRVSGISFFVRRFSRLYPLHFVTLIVVAALQILSMRLLGSWQIYQNNDIYHFILNIFLASNWGFEHGYSFNGPIWSVSVEEVVYILFFVYCRFLVIRLPTTIVLTLLSGVAFALTRHLIFLCATIFYVGGVTYLIWDWLQKYGTRAPVLAGFVWFSATLAFARVLTHWGQPDSRVAFFYWLSLFPSLVLLCAALEPIVPRSTLKRVVWIGDITYSTYLLHIPVQIVILLVLKTRGIPATVADSPWFFLGYVASVILLGLLSYHWLERPAQRYLRETILSRFTPRHRAPAADNSAAERVHPPQGPSVEAGLPPG